MYKYMYNCKYQFCKSVVRVVDFQLLTETRISQFIPICRKVRDLSLLWFLSFIGLSDFFLSKSGTNCSSFILFWFLHFCTVIQKILLRTEVLLVMSCGNLSLALGTVGSFESDHSTIAFISLPLSLRYCLKNFLLGLHLCLTNRPVPKFLVVYR